MSDNLIQTSFAAGELAPSIFARTDLQKYHAGAAVLRNFFVDYRSGASTRAGTKYIIQALMNGVRLIPFQFSTVSSYIIEFGDRYVRFINNGAPVLENGFAISAITNANPIAITAPGSAFVNGDWVFVSGVGGMLQANRFYKIVGGVLCDVNTGIPVDSTHWLAYTSGGTIARVYKIAAPYALADIPLLKYTQSASVMTITHPSYPPANLTQTSPTSWTLTNISFQTPILPPTNLMTATSVAGTANYAFVVTAIDADGNESAPSTPAALASAVNIYGTAGTITVTWTASAGAVSYNVYQAELSFAGAVATGAAFGFVGNVTGTQFDNSSIPVNFDTGPPVVLNPFANGNNPAVNCYFQQRQVFAASNANPTTFWMSQPGGFTPTQSNFNSSDPVEDDDAITGVLVSSQVNAIKWLLPMPGGLVTGTSKGAWQISGGAGNIQVQPPITPSNAQAIPQAYNGASDVPPIVVNYDIVYVQAKGAIVRDLAYNIYANIYTGADISILSNHLFFGHQITQWAYAEEPFKIIWAIRDDGIFLSLTFVKEQEIYGWARHDTLGLAQSVASITEGQVDAVYIAVLRFLKGNWVTTIERMDNRLPFVYGAEDAWCVDCGVQTALIVPIGATMNATASSGTAAFTSNVPVFGPGMPADNTIIRMDGGIAVVTGYTSATQVTAKWLQPATQVLPNDPNKTPVPATNTTTQAAWSFGLPSTVFYGADWLAGSTVSVLADGGVVAPLVVAADGSFTLPQPATKVTIGLGFQAQLQTMPLDVGGGAETVQGKRKKIGALTVRCANTRGLKAGRKFSTLVPIKEMNPNVLLGSPIGLVTGDERVIMDPLWDVPGQICLQQDDPLPATVLGVIPEVVVGDTK
jgi:hypothetical protein